VGASGVSNSPLVLSIDGITNAVELIFCGNINSLLSKI